MNITFFFPYPYISGIPVLFSNLANYLLADSSHEINIIDYRDGALIRSCRPDPRLNFIEFKDFEPCVLDFETHLVMQASLPWKIRQELKISEKVKILQWAAHESNLVPYLSRFNFISKFQNSNIYAYKFLNLINKRSHKILSLWAKTMINRGSIVFMTHEIYNNTVRCLSLDNAHSASYIPNFSFGESGYNEKSILGKSKKTREEIDLCWVGRIANFKVHILNYSITRLSEYALEKQVKIKFHIIGTGDLAKLLRLDCRNPYFEIVNVGALEKESVDKYLEEKVDAMFSMGTAALDGARLGLPVVLLDQSNSEIKDGYIFKFLFASKGFDLGHPVDGSDFEIGNGSLEAIINGLILNYNELSKKTLDYYRGNHSIEAVSAKLLHFMDNNSYRVWEVDKSLVRPDFFRKLYLMYLENVKKSYY